MVSDTSQNKILGILAASGDDTSSQVTQGEADDADDALGDAFRDLLEPQAVCDLTITESTVFVHSS